MSKKQKKKRETSQAETWRPALGCPCFFPEICLYINTINKLTQKYRSRSLSIRPSSHLLRLKVNLQDGDKLKNKSRRYARLLWRRNSPSSLVSNGWNLWCTHRHSHETQTDGTSSLPRPHIYLVCRRNSAWTNGARNKPRFKPQYPGLAMRRLQTSAPWSPMSSCRNAGTWRNAKLSCTGHKSRRSDLSLETWWLDSPTVWLNTIHSFSCAV